MAIEDIAKWQRDFLAAPSVWVTEDPEGHLSGVYESKEAALLEVERYPRYRVRREYIHGLDLAKRRWLP